MVLEFFIYRSSTIDPAKESGIIDTMRDKSASSVINSPGPVIRGHKARAGRFDRFVGMVVYDGVAAFELGVACDFFGATTAEPFGVSLYQLHTCSLDSGPVTTDGGFKILAPDRLDKLRRVGTIVVPPTNLLDDIPDQVYEELRRAHARGCRIISLCTGAFVLARAGLLDGRRATTHWTDCDKLVRTFPQVTVDPGVLYVDDGDILTSAGSAASIDLCFHVVRSDFGAEIATQLARDLVVPPQRDGGQAQFIDTPIPTVESSNLFADTVAWAQEHLNEPLTVNDLAARSAMSPRTFARQFVAAMGIPPHQWLQVQRVHLAQRLLETTDLSVEAVAQSSGFWTAGNLRKHFRRIRYTSPQAYRRAFQDTSLRQAS
jgi:AraC family transcriptional regulator, transcriptional activator FtrA